MASHGLPGRRLACTFLVLGLGVTMAGRGRKAAPATRTDQSSDASEHTARLRISDGRTEAEPGPEADVGLEVAGRLAAELGHDLNNHLSTVLNYSFLLGRAVDRDPALRSHLDELQAAAWRAVDLSHALRLFAPHRSTRREKLDVNEVILAAVPVLRRMLDGCALETRLALRLPDAGGARTELEQVLVGLVVHARQKLGKGGTVLLTTGVTSNRGRAGVRVSCAWRLDARVEGFAPGAMATRGAPRLSLVRRALKRLDARLSHDATAAHVDLPGED